MLDKILMALDIAAELGTSLGGPIGIGSAFAEKLVKIAQAANQAHVAATGQPIDPAKLHEIAPVA